MMKPFPLGATLQKKGVSFNVWAPFSKTVDIKIFKGKLPLILPLKKDPRGYFYGEVKEAAADTRYQYVLDHVKERPDPVSRFQPEGVHGPSQVVDADQFNWKDDEWKGLELSEAIFYELHVGTFTAQGTFEAAIKKIPYLKSLGITCIEIMPVAQFPGVRNWGYDGVGLYAVQNSYGGPEALKKLVNACHRAGLAVCLDVVYNHFGPEGNYLNDFGPYFTKKYNTPWGDAVNYDDRQNREVRRFIIENALYWVREYHMDALRLDAIHGIFDASKLHVLRELNTKVQTLARRLGRRVHVIAESDLNDSKILRPVREKGYALSAQWSDDFHHAVHALLTKETKGYYSDFGGLNEVIKAVRDGFVYDGKYSPFRKKKHGNSVTDLAREKLVVCVQNHDQIGNRAWGERLSVLLPFEKLKLAAALLLLSPNTPMLFMGEEFGETSPFQYFIDHGDVPLIQAVREGRKREFAAFGWKTVPDPASKKTFVNSKLKWERAARGRAKEIFELYRELIKVRKTILAECRITKQAVQIQFDLKKQQLQLIYPSKSGSTHVFFSFSDKKQTIPFKVNQKKIRLVFQTTAFKKEVQSKMNLPDLLPFSAMVIQESGV